MKNNKTHPLGLFCDSGSKLVPSVNQIRKYSKESGLFLRAFRVISPEQLLVALLASVSLAEKSCRAIALELGICGDISVSRKAVWDRLKNPAIIHFLQLIIEHVMSNSIVEKDLLEYRNQWLKTQGKDTISRISRVLIGDATTVPLHPSLANAFPGSKNQTDVPKAHLKLQLVVDLLTGKWIHYSFDRYARSDMKAAMDFVPFLKAGDLLIRDLGYAYMPAFRAIIEAEAFFISRLKSRIHVFNEAGERIRLRKTLQQLAPNVGDVVRIPIFMTETDKVPCILIAKRVPKDVANLRRRKIKNYQKERGFNPPTKRYLQLQEWTLLVTNLESTDADEEEIFQWYEMRWRIENIFKACKSHTSWLKVANHKTNANHAKALILTWFLTMVILADRGAFRMAQIRSRSDGADDYKIEIVNTSILKSIGKLITSFGFQIELAGSNFDCFAYQARMIHYMQKHNKTEHQLNRITLVEILELTLDCDF